jgi:hypothetical protein
MGRRPTVLFWGATAAAVFFLGSAWATAGRLGSDPHALANTAFMCVAIIGFAATALVAGRIAFVAGRTQRRALRTRSEAPAWVDGEEG